MSQKISNLTTYNNELNKSLEEKLFFVEKLPANIEVFFDFGCGDGSLLKAVKEYYPNAYCIGYDNNPDMIALAEKNMPEGFFYDSLYKCVEDLRVFQNTCIILSSVLHEMHTFLNPVMLSYFYRFLFGFQFDYIVIRDMSYNISKDIRSEKSDIQKLIKKEKELGLKYMLTSFHQHSGLITSQRALTHFLLKYRYKNDWEREVNENYFAFDAYDFIKLIPAHYTTIFDVRYTPEWIFNDIKQNFDIKIPGATHCKIILKLNNYSYV